MVMEYNTKELMEKIDRYFEGELSKDDLGRWTERAYYDLLKGGYVENEKIVVYPFVKIISTFHIIENDKDDIHPCAEENVKMIQDILHGRRDFNFTVEISIPIQVYSMFKERYYFDKERRDMFLKLRDMFGCYFEQGQVFPDEIASQVEMIMDLKQQNKTVLDTLEKHILRFIKVLFKNNLDELGLQRNLKLYAQKLEQNTMEEKLISYLDCYIGKRNFEILISYTDGNPDFFIVV